MLFISLASLVDSKRKFKTLYCLAELSFLILCFLIPSNEAGVIKNPDTAVAVMLSGNTESNTEETEVAPTILPALNNASNTFTTEGSVAFEVSQIENATKSIDGNVKSKESTVTKSADIESAWDEPTTEFDNDYIKAEKTRRLKEQAANSSDNKNSSFYKNLRGSNDLNEDLITETEKPLLTFEEQNKQTDNSTENSKEYLTNDLNVQVKENFFILKEAVTANSLELSTLKTLLTTDDTTLNPATEVDDLLISERNKEKLARSMFIEDTTTANIGGVDEFTTVVNLNENIVQKNQQKLQEGVNKTDLSSLNIKEKKPKFINDNSTNAQKLNLPNNAEVWSLASMKAPPKVNITIETVPVNNQTDRELEEPQNTKITLGNNNEKNLLDWLQIMRNKELETSTRNENNNTQKDTVSETEKNVNSSKILESINDNASLSPENARAQFKAPSDTELPIKNSLVELPELNTSTIAPILMSTSLSILNYNESDNNIASNQQHDKKLEENMDNNIEPEESTSAATTVATNVFNNPLNTSLNIEPNLNKINLPSNQTDVIDVDNTTTAGKKSAADDNVNANTAMETSTLAAMPPTTEPITSTEATAVVDMTTVEQISSETSKVSTLETTKQNTLLSSVVTNEQQQRHTLNKSNNVINEEANSKLSALIHNAKQTTQYANIDLNTKTATTTVVPITTYRPNILAITLTTSFPLTLKAQEVDQNSNENEKNLTDTNAEEQSIIETDLHYIQSTEAVETHLTAREFETSTLETTLTTTTAAEQATKRIENNLIHSLSDETATTTSSSTDESINETTTELSVEKNDLNESTNKTIQITTPKQVSKERNIDEEEATTTRPTSSHYSQFEKETNITTAAASETLFSLNTSTETPVVIETESGKIFDKSTTPTTTTTTTSAAIATEKTLLTTATDEAENDTKKRIFITGDILNETTTTISINNTEEITVTSTAMSSSTVEEEETYINLLDDITTTPATNATSTTSSIPTTSTSPAPLTTLPPLLSSPPSTPLPTAITTKLEEIYNVTNSNTTEAIQPTTTQQMLTEIVEKTIIADPTSSSPSISTSKSTHFTENLPAPTTTTESSQIIATAEIGKSLPTLNTVIGGNSGNMYPKNSQASYETDVNVIIAITVSVIGVVALVLLVGFLYLMRKRQKQTSYSQRCRPVSLDEYTIDNVSVGGSMRKSSALRASKRTYGNLAFDDPALRRNPLGVQDLSKFVQEKLRIYEEFRDVPQITSRLDEVPMGCEDKNRYANVLPLPETRVILQRLNDDEKSEYINANYVAGPNDPPNYYIACQAPLESTVEDFWRMIWEEQSRVIIQATDLIENGVEKCAEYLPPSVTLDNHSSFGNFQITLQNREIKDKYAISTILIKNVSENATRELTHYWYKWPEVGVPNEEAPIIAMLLEVRSSLISYSIEQANEDEEKFPYVTSKSAEDGTIVVPRDSSTSPQNPLHGTNSSNAEINGNISMVQIKKPARNQRALTIHCSPGTGRTGTIISCDIALRSLETPKRIVDIPQIVYYVRRGRASAVLTKEQYEFIYKVANMYAAKITNPTHYN